MPMAPKDSRASIEDLPNELLTIIFKIVHGASHKESFHVQPTAIEDPYDKNWFSRESLVSPARFPNALAQVCLTWRTIMSSVPSFWTDIIVVVNNSSPVPFSFRDVRSALGWARDLPLNVAVTRQPNVPIPSSLDERRILSPLINLLAPQIHRCQSFSFYTTHSSALPQLGHNLGGSAPLLKELKLECEVDDRATSDIVHDWHGLYCPSLFNLIINGSNFTNITHYDPHWFTNLPGLRWVTFNRLAPPAEGDISGIHISFSRFMEILANENLELDYLRIFDFNPGFYDLDPSEEFALNLDITNRLVLEDLSDLFVHNFSYTIFLHADELHISRCSLTSMVNIPFTESLTLEDISPTDDLSICLRRWPGSVLTLSRCPSFDDCVLNMMGDPDILRDFDNSPNSLIKLILIDCPNFSIEALKVMIEGRNEDVEDVLRYYGPPAIEGLKVYGKGPSLYDEDVDWFKGKLRYLDWHIKQEDGTANLVEFDAEEQIKLDFD